MAKFKSTKNPKFSSDAAKGAGGQDANIDAVLTSAGVFPGYGHVPAVCSELRLLVCIATIIHPPVEQRYSMRICASRKWTTARKYV